MSHFKVEDVALFKERLVILHMHGPSRFENKGWGVAYLHDYIRGPSSLFGVKENELRPVLWTFTGFVGQPCQKVA